MIQLDVGIQRLEIPAPCQLDRTLGDTSRQPGIFSETEAANDGSADTLVVIALDTATDHETVTGSQRVAGQ